MVSRGERRRALARAKWQRQQARRTDAQRRARRFSIIGGAAVAVIAAGAIGYGGYALVTSGSDSPGSTTPTDNFPSLLQPTNPGITAYTYSPDKGSASNGSPGSGAPPSSPTAPADTSGTSSP